MSEDDDADPRVTCNTCMHARGERCAAHPGSGLVAGYIGGMVDLLQHCPAWRARAADHQQAHDEPVDPREQLRRQVEALRLRRRTT